MYDFLISNNGKLKYKLYPIEVKSGRTYSTGSIMNFKDKYKSRIGECYIINPKNFAIRDDTVCIRRI